MRRGWLLSLALMLCVGLLYAWAQDTTVVGQFQNGIQVGAERLWGLRRSSATGITVGGTDVASVTITTGAVSRVMTAAGATTTLVATQTIAATETIASDACGGIKRITAASGITTNTTNTIADPTAVPGCVMFLVNVGAQTITLDKNALILLVGGTDVALLANSTITVISDGVVWRQTSAQLTATWHKGLVRVMPKHSAKERATRAAYARRKRAEVRLAKENASMSERPASPVLLDDPPVLVRQDDLPPAYDSGAPTPRPAPVSPPTLDPVPSLDELPTLEHHQFSYDVEERLSPEGLQGITVFHQRWMQSPSLKAQMDAESTLAGKRNLLLLAQTEARRILPHLEQQYREACIGNQANSQEALTIKRNLEWVVQQLLAKQV